MLAATPLFFFFFFNDTATTEIYTLSLHDALPISLLGAVRQLVINGQRQLRQGLRNNLDARQNRDVVRSEEHTSELQSPCNLVCRLLLEKKKHIQISRHERTPDSSSSRRAASTPQR